MIADPIREGLARGWKTLDAATVQADREMEFDVVVVGSGAGGGITAEALANAGLAVAIVEEGPLASSSQFRMREHEAYTNLYQESAARRTSDRGITLLQGRCVGGSTTVNWTSSFRTPETTLRHWREAFGAAAMTEMAPWFAEVERKLSIAPWPAAPNENNDLLRRGCEKLGWSSGAIARNVRGCLDIGYCGMGCPTNAKQSMLVTSIPAALDRGATLVYRARVERLELRADRAVACEARGIAGGGGEPMPHRIRLRARHFVLAAGGLGTPAILMRSDAPDPHLLLGRGTFLHPTVVSAAVMPQKVDGFYGAPQSVYSDHFLDSAPLDGPVGFKLESGPTHPLLVGITLPGFGEPHARWMRQLPHVQVTIALLRDGFHRESPGGRVHLRRDGTPLLDYPMTPYLWEGVRRAYLAMAEVQFAAGAREVMPVHEAARVASSFDEARTLIASLPLEALAARLVSAHVMGGCPMGPDARRAVVREDGRHHQIGNVSVHDASIFPTSLGTNPQVSIYAQAARLSAGLGRSLRA